MPYVREQQQKRLRAAERALGVLGRVNSLALEEFDAMEERHKFLPRQLEDLRRTRADLMDMIARSTREWSRCSPRRTRTWSGVRRVFARLFPGGEGRLLLTKPGTWLTTGVEVEARPPARRSTAVAAVRGRAVAGRRGFPGLAVPGPAQPVLHPGRGRGGLDDTNLGRLLEIYEELRASSQLLVITHQKRTMEVADALYGVTMRGDGVSAVITQRLRETESVAQPTANVGTVTKPQADHGIADGPDANCPG